MNKKITWDKIKNEYFGQGFTVISGILIVILTLSIIFFIASKGIRIFTVQKYSISEFLFSTKWLPDAEKHSFGILIFIIGSISVSLGAVLISTPIALALAVFMRYISPKLGKKILQPSMELFVGIPSVVYGWVGVSILVPFIKNNFGGIGFSLLAGILVLSIMILPTITSISYDALSTVPSEYLEASYGLGATRWQTITKVIVPACKTGIMTGIVLGLARAFGEALAVQMVIGNTIKVVNGVLKPTSTLTSILTMDMANTLSGTIWNDALWAMALFLLIISFIFILVIRFIARRGANL
ncbi:phosphate ABC transporter permease subunit PstC [Haloimpatiens sp. FM7315]|uniref:phosphate ABC transporter permease subunit PstC n=1 Tax=Haloimpatiens sp. FM7315 TaxID=3298609 RepID=UPI0035A33074